MLGSVRIECLGTQNRNPNLKPEPAPNFYSGRNLHSKLNSVDARTPNFIYKIDPAGMLLNLPFMAISLAKCADLIQVDLAP